MKGEIKTVQDVKGELVYFENGSRVPLNRMAELFEEVKDGGLMAPGAAKKLIMESVTDPDVVDPSTFFNQPTGVLETIKKKVEVIDTSKLQEQVVSTPTIKQQQQVIPNPPDPWFDPMPQPAKVIDVQRDDNDTTKVIATRDINQPLSSEEQGANLFKKLKRNHEIDITIRLVDRIPNLDFIRMMDENFDQGILEYLVQNITEQFLAAPNIIQNQVREQLKNKIYGPTKSTKNSKSTKKKKNGNNSTDTSSN